MSSGRAKALKRQIRERWMAAVFWAQARIPGAEEAIEQSRKITTKTLAIQFGVSHRTVARALGMQKTYTFVDPTVPWGTRWKAWIYEEVRAVDVGRSPAARAAVS